MLEFRFTLALALGIPVGELMGRMSALEETYWVARYRDNPFGDHRADVRNAQVLQMLYSVNAGKKSERKKLSDFMPFFRKRVKPDEQVTDSVRSVFGNIIKHQDK